VKFHAKMAKLKLKTFGDLSKELKVHRGTSKEVFIRADHALFAQMIIIAENRKLKMNDVLRTDVLVILDYTMHNYYFLLL